MATHSSILTWEISCTEEPGRLQSMRLQRARHNLVTKQKHWTMTQAHGASVMASSPEAEQEFLDLGSGKLLAFPYLEMTCWHVCMEYVLQPYQVCLLERKCDQFVVNGMITMIFKTGNLENFQLPSF